MTQPSELFCSAQKSDYLFTRDSTPKKGGDKRKFWREILGFDSPEAIRIALLDSVKLKDLYYRNTDQYGERYQAVTDISGPTGEIRKIRTG